MFGPVSTAVPITRSAPLALSRPRTPVVSFLTMPPFQSCIAFTSSSILAILMPIAAGVLRLFVEVRGGDERLGGDAAPVEAHAAHVLFLDAGHLLLELPEPDGARIAARAAADHNCVVTSIRHRILPIDYLSTAEFFYHYSARLSRIRPLLWRRRTC